MKYCFLFILLMPVFASAKLYQCTNANGDVSFSNLPCPAADEKKALEFTDAQGAVEVDPSIQTPYFDLPSASPLCRDAVENSQYTLEQMERIGKQNYNGGYIEKEAYETTLKMVNEAQALITTSTCENSTGADREFFECMESGYTLIISCLQDIEPPFLIDE